MLLLWSIALAGVCTDFNGALGPGSWTATPMPGGTAGVAPGADASALVFSYSKPDGASSEATFEAIASGSGQLTVAWDHAWDHGFWSGPIGELDLVVGATNYDLHYSPWWEVWVGSVSRSGTLGPVPFAPGDVLRVRVWGENGNWAGEGMSGTITLSALSYDSVDGCDCAAVIGGASTVDACGVCDDKVWRICLSTSDCRTRKRAGTKRRVG